MSPVHRRLLAWGLDPKLFTQWRWQMAHQIRNLEEAQALLELSSDEIQGFQMLKDIFAVGITPYYLALMGDHDCPIRKQALPQISELKDALGVADPLAEVPHSPVPEVVQVYPDRVAFCVAQLCPVYCRYCFRKRRDDEEGLHFNRQIIDRGVAYIASQPAIRDVLITGGDPFLASDQALRQLLEKIRAIPHVEIIRFGTRTPVTLPYRITPELVEILKAFHPLYVNTHFNCAEEFSPEAEQALRLLADAGIPLGNQAVLLKGVNDSPQAMLALCRKLLQNRVKPYYVFHPHRIEGTEHLRTTVTEGLKIMQSLRGHITGMGIPSYILDTPSGKVPLGADYRLMNDGEDLIVRDLRGGVWRELGVL